MNEKLISRIKLLYQRNNSSPLFLKAADLCISDNQFDTARQILEQGLKIFPQHPLAYILLGKVNYLTGNIDEADSFFKQASDLLNSDRTYFHYKKELKIPDKPDSPFNFSRGNIFINSFASENPSIKDSEISDTSESVDDKLEQLAEKIMNARVERKKDFHIPEDPINVISPDKTILASETLANIYLSQGERNEAIKIFEILSSRNPEKRDYYAKKITEIKSH